MSAVTLLEVESLTKRYGSITAVDDLSFSVAPGETLGLLGPNGAGKTTTMGCIVGLLEPDGGHIAVDGLAPKSKTVSAMVGYAAQRTALYLSLRVSENLAYFDGLYGLRGRALSEAVAKIVDLFDLDSLIGRRVNDLSVGQAKLVHLTSTVIHEPTLLLVDEPTAGLDVSARRRVIDAIRRLAAGGTAVIFSTHYLEEADEACDSLVIIDHGRRVAAGPLDDLLAADPDPATIIRLGDVRRHGDRRRRRGHRQDRSAAGLGAGHRPGQPCVLGDRRLPQRAQRRAGIRPRHRHAGRVRSAVHRHHPVAIPSPQAERGPRRVTDSASAASAAQ